MHRKDYTSERRTYTSGAINALVPMGVYLWESGMQSSPQYHIRAVFDVKDYGVFQSAERHGGYWLLREHPGGMSNVFF
ncbi:hypothetical protein TNCV_786851 [Trichonephila clavipes]|nr:hypothetical protein TNCV_786851 [Trichonephila clavipes]